MDVTVSKSSFGQSAKILAEILEDKFGAAPRGHLSWTKECLAQALKFNSVHALDAFFDKDPLAHAPAASRADSPRALARGAPAPHRFGALPADERLHALLALSSSGSDYSEGMFRSRSDRLLSTAMGLVSAQPADTYLRRLEDALGFDFLFSSWRDADRSSSAWAKLNEFLGALPKFDPATNGGAMDVDEARAQHKYLQSMAVKAIRRAADLERFGPSRIVPGAVLGYLARLKYSVGHDDYLPHAWMEGSWLADKRIDKILLRGARKELDPARPPKDVSAWEFLLAALKAPIESDRESALRALLELSALPAAHFAAAADILDEAEQRLIRDCATAPHPAAPAPAKRVKTSKLTS